MNKIYKLVWSKVRNMWVVASEFAKSHSKSHSSVIGKKPLHIGLLLALVSGSVMTVGVQTVQADAPVLTDEQKNEIADKVLEKLNNNENIAKKIQDEVFKYKNKLVFAGGVIGKQKSPSDTPMAFGNGAFANGSDGISLGYQADAFSAKAISIGARASTLWNGDVAVGNQTHVAGLSAALGSGTELYANQSVALGTQIKIVDPEVLELYKKYNYTNPDNKGAVDVPSWYWREQIGKDTPEIQDFKKRYAGFLGTLDKDGLDPTYHDELYKQKLIETIMWEKTTKKIQKATAVGFQSGAKVTGGVALGAFSNATRKSEVIGYNPNGEQYQNVADFLVRNNKKEAYVKALQEQETLEKEVSNLETQRKSLSGEPYREISEKAYEKNKEAKKAAKKVNDLYNAWLSIQGAVAVGNEETGMTRQITGVSAGSEDTDAVNVAQLKAVNTKIDNNQKAMEQSLQNSAVKYVSINPENNKRPKPAKGSDNSKNDGAYGENSVAIGAFSEAADRNTLAVGWSAKAQGNDSLALGTMVYSYGSNSNAVGNQAAALGEEASAFGNQAKAMDMGTTALGNNAMAIQNGSTAVGYQSLSAIASTSMGTNSFALGQASLALGQQSYIGDTTFRDTYTKYNEEKGNDNNIPGFYISDLINKNDPKIAKYKEQFKNQLQGLDGHNQEAVLRYLIISDLNKQVQFATAVGNHSTVGASQGTALGFYSTVTGAYGTALGYNSVSTAYGAMAAGAYAKANTVGSVAIGFKSKVDNYGGVAIGSEATVGKNGGVALGNKSTADRGNGAVGYVFGADNSTLTKALEAPGNKARFEELKMKIKDEDVSAYNALVMTFKNAAKDSPEKEKAKQEIEKWKAAHPDFLNNVKARKNFENAWQATYEAVSVGDIENGITRQITGVAAGSEDTDAVNAAQLKALAAVPMNFYSGGVKDKNNVYTPGGTNWSMPLNEFRMDFGDGLKAEKVEKDGKTYTLVTLDKETLKNDSSFKGEKGDAGKDGVNGTNGKSAYELWKAQPGHDGKTEQDFLKGLKGEKGADGAKGADGTNGKSAYELWKEQKNSDGSKPNENKSEQDFLKGLKGEKGAAGKDGTNGSDGKSAFELWKAQPGNDGKSEQDFLNGLKGKDGAKGADGTNGKSAYELWKEQKNSDGSKPNENKSEQDFLNGLKGEKGAAGKDGANGTDGKSAFELWKEQKDDHGNQPNKDKTEKDFFDSLKGEKGEKGAPGTGGSGTAVEVKDDAKSGIKVTSDVADGKTTYTVGIGDSIKVGDRVTIDTTSATIGDVKIDGTANQGTITGLSNTKWDGQRIVSGRAATEDQLQQATETIQHHMVEMGQRVDHVGAKSAALAALHPLDYDADDKWDFSAAVGNYNGVSSVALGAFYRPNERTMISMGGTLGGEDNMVNLGVSLKTGSGVDGQVYTSRTAMAKEIKALKEKEAARDAVLQQMAEREAVKDAEITKLKEKDAQREEQLRKLIALVTAMQHK